MLSRKSFIAATYWLKQRLKLEASDVVVSGMKVAQPYMISKQLPRLPNPWLRT
jgi:hypothetical protein